MGGFVEGDADSLRACNDFNCTPECRDYMKMLRDELGCCIAETLEIQAVMADHLDPSLLDIIPSGFYAGDYFAVCDVTAPTEPCDKEFFDMLHSKSSPAPSTQPTADGGKKKKSNSAMAVTAVTAVACVLAVGALVAYVVHRRHSARVDLAYQPVGDIQNGAFDSDDDDELLADPPFLDRSNELAGSSEA